MNVWKKTLVLGGCMAALTLGSANHAMAQGRDPAQMRQGRLDDLRDKLEIKDDAEWLAIEPKVTKVMDAGRDVMGMRLSGMFGNRGRRREGGDNNGGENRPRRNPFFGEPSPSIEALQKAIDSKAPAAELKAKMAAVRAETKEKEDKLASAEEDLRSVLTPRQEAVAMVNGLLR